MELSTLAEIEATEMFEDESADWRYCVKEATFAHTSPDACEFIFHIGDPLDRRLEAPGDSYADHRVEEMRAFGCSEEFVGAYLEALAEGAVRVLFWA
jgi:hypothetical protein